MNMAPGYRVVMAGETEEWRRRFGYMVEALFLAVIFVYLILAAQFESFLDPFAIMLSLPLSIVGMAGMLLAHRRHRQHHVPDRPDHADGAGDQERDPADRLRQGGCGSGAWTAAQALIEAGRTRLRPIMMTTAGDDLRHAAARAWPSAPGAEMRAPMARAVVGGLITSTLLTLLVVPVVYTLLDDLAGAIRRRFSRAARAERKLAHGAEKAVPAGLLLALLARRARFPSTAAAASPSP